LVVPDFGLLSPAFFVDGALTDLDSANGLSCLRGDDLVALGSTATGGFAPLLTFRSTVLSSAFAVFFPFLGVWLFSTIASPICSMASSSASIASTESSMRMIGFAGDLMMIFSIKESF
jgi:hypothetical protein